MIIFLLFKQKRSGMSTTVPSTNHLSKARREAQLREALRRLGEVEVRDMARQLGVSEMTVRRDLDRLERAGHVHRTHGGAVAAERLGFEFDFVVRRQANQRAKRAIAAEALRLLQPGDRVLLDAGTTTLELASLLRGLRGLVVITPSLAVASELQFADEVQTILLGGILRKGSPDLTGEVTESVLERLSVDIAFQGADGIGLDGSLYTADLSVARVDEKVRMRSARTYVLADSSKVGRTALARHGRLQDMTGWITDAGISPASLAQFRALGVEVRVVPPL
jgi:DeoR/GlpR family transcriptional regulator of sugar metabolism